MRRGKAATTAERDQPHFHPDRLVQLALDPAEAPQLAARKFPEEPSAAEHETLVVHAAWRRAAETPADHGPAEPTRPAALFERHPLAWGNYTPLTHRKLWLSWERADGAGTATLCSTTLNNLAHHARGLPRPDGVVRAAMGRRLEQIALQQGGSWPFCPCINNRT